MNNLVPDSWQIGIDDYTTVKEMELIGQTPAKIKVGLGIYKFNAQKVVELRKK